MGRSYTPAYRVEANGPMPTTWDSKRYGRPTDAKLAQVVSDYAESTKPGGANAHLGQDFVCTFARVVHQSTGEQVASWDAPMFEIVS